MEAAETAGLGSLPVGALGTMRANYYSGGAWMLLSSFLHYTWADRRRAAAAREAQRPEPSGVHIRNKGPEHTPLEIKVVTVASTMLYVVLALHYRTKGEPGAWGFVAITATLQAACAVLAVF